MLQHALLRRLCIPLKLIHGGGGDVDNGANCDERNF
jgi:hypothetical protein